MNLPYCGKLVKDSIVHIKQTMKNTPESPGRAMNAIIVSSMKIQTAIGLLIATKLEVMRNAFFLSGRRPYWMNFGNEFQLLVSELLVSRDLLQKRLKKYTEDSQYSDSTENFDNARSLSTQELKAIETLLETIKPVADSFIQLYNLAEPLLDKFSLVMQTIDSIKEGFGEMKGKLKEVQGMLVRLFGPKLAKSFPLEPANCGDEEEEEGGKGEIEDGKEEVSEDDSCQCGRFPFNGDDQYRDGLAVAAPIGKCIPAPFGGYAFDGPLMGYEENSAVIRVTDLGMKGHHIIIHNVAVNSSISNGSERGKRVYKGEVIGKVIDSGSEACENFIHFVLLKGEDIQDPTPIFERTHLPIPGFDTECDDYRLVVMGATLAEGQLTDLPKLIYDKIKRARHKDIEDEGDEEDESMFKEYDVEPFSVEIPEVFTEDDWLAGVNKTMNETKSDFIQAISETFLASIGGSLPQNYKVKEIFNILENANATKELDDFREVIEVYLNVTQDQECIITSQFSENRLRWYMSKNRISTTEDYYELLKRAHTISASTIECKNLKDALSEMSSTHCSAHGDCLGAVCCMTLQYGYLNIHHTINFRADFCKRSLNVAVINENLAILFNESQTIRTLAKGHGFDNETVSLHVEIANVTDDILVASIGLQLCIDHYGGCLPVNWLFKEVMFSGVCIEGGNSTDDRNDGEGRNSTDDGEGGSSYSEELLQLTIGQIQEELMYSDVDMKQVLDVITAVRTILLQSAMEGIYNNIISDSEFPDIENSCKSGVINFPSKSVTFFETRINFMAGPVPVQFEFQAGGAFAAKFEMKLCFMTMAADAALIPGQK